MEDANTGPLEATIANVTREIANKVVEGKELQRRWVGFQVELVALVNENNHMEETVQVRATYRQHPLVVDAVDNVSVLTIRGVDDIGESHTTTTGFRRSAGKHVASHASSCQGVMPGSHSMPARLPTQ
eukprot:49789-Prorocentrum_minimum.AAC.3